MSDTDLDAMESEMDGNAIAIVGMACRFPGASNTRQFWNNLKQGKEALTLLSDEELREGGVSERELEDPNYVKAGMFLKQMECFDAGFFGFNPQEARIMDPQHRHFLECAWETFEDAGYVPGEIDGSVGVFAGSGHNAYMPYNLLPNRELVDQVGFFLLRHTGNDKDFLSTRVSYLLNLKGPSVNVQTACSTSLVAAHMAAQSLLAGECDMALAGGVTIELPHRRGYLYKDSEILSKDGHCRPFEQASGGTVFGSGVGCVLLKRLEDALADGDHIHAVMKASAINNDGSDKVSYLAPSVDGQAAAVREAIEIADIDPTSVGFIECHGTGTAMGDPIEVTALSQAYGLDNPRKQYCALGSVKSNIGHLDTAAGIAGMIKAILSLQHRQLVPTLHYNAPNPAIDFASTPFYVNHQLRDWQSEAPRRAAVSSLGVGGTNAHIILEEMPVPADEEHSGHSVHVITLSAKTESSLNSAAKKLSVYLESGPEACLADIAYTLNVGRKDFAHRLALPVTSVQDAAEQLSDLTALASAKAHVEEAPSLVFMLPGGGAQYSGMGADLYQQEDVYREAFDACLACLPEQMASKVRALVFAPESERAQATEALQTPTLTLTSLFATEYALAKQMFAWGIRPAALIGHSMGENTAACLAGVMSLHDAMNLVYLRGQLFERAPEGGMLSVPMPIDDARKYMTDELDVAAINAPDLCVVTGPKQALGDLQVRLEQDDIESTSVRINVAAHSRMLDSILDEFRAYLASIQLSSPSIPFTSNLTGNWITDEQAMSPDYWVEHLRNTVKFSENVATVLQEGPRILLEIGPGRTLTNLAMANAISGSSVLSAMRHHSESISDVVAAKRTVGAMWAHGLAIDWSDYWQGEYRFRVPLPTYAFEKKRHWVAPVEQIGMAQSEELRKQKDMDDWFARLVWRQRDLTQFNAEDEADYLVFAEASALSEQLLKELDKRGASYQVVRRGKHYRQESTRDFYLPCDDERAFFDFSEQALDNSDRRLKLIYLWTLAGTNTANTKDLSDTAFWGLFYMLKMLAELDRAVELCVVTDQLASLSGESIVPEASLALGPVLVAERELPHVSTRIVDMRWQSGAAQRCAGQLLKELAYETEHSQVAYRGRHRWVRDIDSVSLKERRSNTDWLADSRVALISGGLGGIGLNIAQLLCRKGAEKIILLSRSELPEPDGWGRLLEQLPETDAMHTRLSALKKLQESATEVVLVSADVTDTEGMSLALAKAGVAVESVNMVVHAAGIMDDKLLIEKTAEEAARVLRVKVEGAKALDQLFADTGLERFVVFSSVASYLGLPGQIDYTAANAFLDAFVAERSERRSGKSIAVNWSAWKEVGMAANMGHESTGGLPVEHSLLDRTRGHGEEGRLYSVLLHGQQDWLVEEHKTQDGFHLVPGTGFVELIRSACAHFLSGDARHLPLTINQLTFNSAFEVPSEGARQLNIALENTASGLAVSVYAEDEEMPLVTADVVALEAQEASADIPGLKERCQVPQALEEGYMDRSFMAFGPRWGCIESIFAGQSEALVSCRLAEQYVSDFEQCKLHPALLDMATGCGQFLDQDFVKGRDFYVPVSYESIRIMGAMPSSFLSHVQLLPAAQKDQLQFDITLMQEDGEVFMRVGTFTMQKLAQGFATTLPEHGNHQSEEMGLTPEQERLAEILREAILPQEGIEAFDRVMSVLDDETQFVIASIDTALWQRKLLAQFGGETDVAILESEEPEHDADADPDIPKVEAALVAAKGVEKAAVRSFLDDDEERRIIAYYLPDDWERVTVTELRNEISTKLPAELQPQQFVELAEWPLGRDGNLDRSELLDPFAPVDNYIAPKTPTEKRLEKIWQGVLGVPKVSLNENFFDIGGHSLLSIRVIVKVKKEFGVRLDQAKMVLLTLEQMAKDIDDQVGTKGTASPATEKEKAEKSQDAVTVSTEAEAGKPARKKLFQSLFKKGKD